MVKVPILFQDDHLVIVDKPVGFLVVPAPGRRKRRPFVGSSDEDGPAKGKSVGQSPKRRGPLD